MFLMLLIKCESICGYDDTFDTTHRNPPTSTTQYFPTYQEEEEDDYDNNRVPAPAPGYIPAPAPGSIPTPVSAPAPGSIQDFTAINNSNFDTNETKPPSYHTHFLYSTPKKYKGKRLYNRAHSPPYTIREDCELMDNEVSNLTSHGTFNYTTFSNINTTTGDNTNTTGYWSDSFGGGGCCVEYKGNCKIKSGIHGYKKSLPIDIPRPVVKPVILHL